MTQTNNFNTVNCQYRIIWELVPKVNNRPYSSCIREIVNSLSEDTKLTISLCKENKVYYSPLERVLKLSYIGNWLYFLGMPFTILKFFKFCVIIVFLNDSPGKSAFNDISLKIFIKRCEWFFPVLQHPVLESYSLATI